MLECSLCTRLQLISLYVYNVEFYLFLPVFYTLLLCTTEGLSIAVKMAEQNNLFVFSATLSGVVYHSPYGIKANVLSVTRQNSRYKTILNITVDVWACIQSTLQKHNIVQLMEGEIDNGKQQVYTLTEDHITMQVQQWAANKRNYLCFALQQYGVSTCN